VKSLTSPQLDIVFPASDELEKALASVQPTHRKKRCTLSEFLDFASSSADGYAHIPNGATETLKNRLVLHSNVIALPSTSECDDTWCIDPRGVLTLCVSKSLYEQLGLVGKRLSFKGCPEQYGTSGIQGYYGSCAKEK
jgi:ribonuclease P/MRP protein subunit RPP40